MNTINIVIVASADVIFDAQKKKSARNCCYNLVKILNSYAMRKEFLNVE